MSAPKPRVCERTPSSILSSRRTATAIASHTHAILAPKHGLRFTVIASTIFVAALIAIRVAWAGEIDLTKLVPGYSPDNNRPVIVVANGKLTNTGGSPAMNFEITKPRYQLIGTLAAGASIDLPGNQFTIQYEWIENEKTQRASRTFTVEPPASKTAQKLSAKPIEPPAPPETPAPAGITATYDPVTHLLTVSAEKQVEVRVDGFLMRPVSRTDKDGAQYRYIDAHVLVLGQDIEQGTTVTLEVVFTKPQDFYSIPIYVREPGKPPVYFTVSVSTQVHA